MKILIIIGVVQVAMILLLFTKITDLDDQISQLTAADQEMPASDDSGSSEVPVFLRQPRVYENEDQLRQIIREELTAQLEGRSGPVTNLQDLASPVDGNPEEAASRREAVAQQLEYYASIGSISDIEMEKLQMDIARLDPASRTEMLRELTRALNSGRLEGQL